MPMQEYMYNKNYTIHNIIQGKRIFHFTARRIYSCCSHMWQFNFYFVLVFDTPVTHKLITASQEIDTSM